MPHPKTSPSKPAAKTIAKTFSDGSFGSTVSGLGKTIAKSKSKSKVAKPKEPKAKSPATEALKALQQCGLRSETIAHRVAALMTGKQPDAEHLSNASIEKQALLSAQLVFSNAEALVPKIAAKVNDEVTRHHEVIACEIKTVGAAAFMKLIPTHRNLHRHVAVLLPEYDATAYHYKQRVTGTAISNLGRPPPIYRSAEPVFAACSVRTAPPRCPAPTASPGRRAARPTRRTTHASPTSGEV